MKIAALFAAVTVVAALPAAAAAQTDPAPDEPLKISKERIGKALNGVLERGEAMGLVARVYQDGEKVYEAAFGEADLEANESMAQDTLFRIYSMTKPITGVALMTLYEQGLFDLDDPITDYVPEFEDVRVFEGLDEDGEPILVAPERMPTVRDFTRHTAGLGGGDIGGYPQRAYEEAGVRDMDITLEEEVRRLASVPLAYQPGTQWHYSDAVEVQALMVERLSGMPFDAYVQKTILDPLDMKDTGYVVPEEDRDRLAEVYTFEDGELVPATGEASLAFNLSEHALTPGSWGLVSTIRDYSRFARMLLGEGTFEEVTILKPETVELMATDALPDGLTDTHFLPNKGQVGFGIDFAVRTAPPASPDENVGAIGEFTWDGYASTLFWVDPANDLTALIFYQIVPFDDTPQKAFRKAVYGAD
ncbi:serine hydrolase domain-containing protein [Parvularcula dongshanensis]|uniref:CubicO group peptidase (Beta-lactamase class C family) n=1 Tax=Parvularcula dongshanensis TaxID=1173995 RepID=A0A840I426_9PROT|nr:serine hydrolase domain-containing protein [Parvularcula dongshanensis]MBB4658790.1 CubicO group peptidase (beta-lactamase class C family) [Parvularcula dongshanensis]